MVAARKVAKFAILVLPFVGCSCQPEAQELNQAAARQAIPATALDALGHTWELAVPSASVGSQGELLLAPRASVVLRESVPSSDYQLSLTYHKGPRWSYVGLPGGYRIQFGGRNAKGNGVIQKYGTHISLHLEGEEVAFVPNQDVRSGQQKLIVQDAGGQLRIYCCRLWNNTFLHSDSTWRTAKSPCIVYSKPQRHTQGRVVLQAGEVAPPSKLFRFDAFDVLKLEEGENVLANDPAIHNRETESSLDSLQAMGHSWRVAVPRAMVSEAGDLLLAADARAELSQSATLARQQVSLTYFKSTRWSFLQLPAGFEVQFGGRQNPGNGVVQKYGTHISLYHDAAEVAFVPNQDTRSGRQTLTVRMDSHELRIYCRRAFDNKYLHGDSAWRAVPGPCIVYPYTFKEPFSGTISLKGGSIAPRSGMHTFCQLQISKAEEIPGETYIDVPSDVPSLASAGLKIPQIDSPWEHIGFAFRGDGGHQPVDDPRLLELVSISPFGPPPDPKAVGLKRLAYMIETVWTPGEWADWKSYCDEKHIDPNVGAVGDWHERDDTGIGSKELASAELREWINQRAAALMADPQYDGIFFDVCYPYKPQKYTTREWADLQGTLYREIWQTMPAGKFPMVNVGNGKTDRNRRICEWIPILYLDRQSGPSDWEWFEWTAIRNPKYRQALLGSDWISVLDGWGTDENCLDENVKYGWLTQYYCRLTNLGGYSHRHFQAGGFNGDVTQTAEDGSGREMWRQRHYVPASEFDVGNPVGEVNQIDSGVREFANGQWTWRAYRAEFENATIYHFPNYQRLGKYDAADLSVAPSYSVEFDEPVDVLLFDGRWARHQTSVNIPAGSGRVVRPSQSN